MGFPHHAIGIAAGSSKMSYAREGNLRRTMGTRERSAAILANNRSYISGGVVWWNRGVEPGIVFTNGGGAHFWNTDGQEYIDYQAALEGHFLTHHGPCVEDAVRS